MADVALRPNGSFFFGVFQTPNTAGGDGSAYSGYQTWNWTGDWKNQIDTAQGLGANLFVYFGDLSWTVHGTINQATYIAERKQILDYCEQVGMYTLSYEMFTMSSWAGIGLTNTQAIPALQAVATLLAGYKNPIGMVLTDESFDSGVSGTFVTNLAAQYSAVKAILPANLPVAATSNPCGTGSGNNRFAYSGTPQTIADAIAPYCDFFCFNQQATATIADSGALRAAYPTKQIILGGSVASTSDSTAASITTSLMGLVGTNKFVGFGYFIALDFGGNAYGLFNSNLTYKTTRTDAFKAGLVPYGVAKMAWQYSAGVNPVSTTLSSSPSAGGTSFTITSATGLPTIATGGFGTARIEAEGANTAEDIIYTRSGSTITLANSTTLASAHASGAAIDFDVMSQAALDQLKNDALSGGPHGANITGAGALTLGIMNFVNLTSGNATLTLANGTFDGQTVGIQMLDTCTKLATIDPAGATNIDGALTRIMWANETAWLAWDNANSMWRKVAGKSIPMMAAMYLASNTGSTVNATETLVALDTKDFDTTGLMVNVGANKITLQRPGNYLSHGFVVIDMGANAGTIMQANTYQGSTRIFNGVSGSNVGSFWNNGGVKNFIGAANDDLTLKYYQNSGLTTPILIGGLGVTWLGVTEIPVW